MLTNAFIWNHMMAMILEDVSNMSHLLCSFSRISFRSNSSSSSSSMNSPKNNNLLNEQDNQTQEVAPKHNLFDEKKPLGLNMSQPEALIRKHLGNTFTLQRMNFKGDGFSNITRVQTENRSKTSSMNLSKESKLIKDIDYPWKQDIIGDPTTNQMKDGELIQSELPPATQYQLPNVKDSNNKLVMAVPFKNKDVNEKVTSKDIKSLMEQANYTNKYLQVLGETIKTKVVPKQKSVEEASPSIPIEKPLFKPFKVSDKAKRKIRELRKTKSLNEGVGDNHSELLNKIGSLLKVIPETPQTSENTSKMVTRSTSKLINVINEDSDQNSENATEIGSVSEKNINPINSKHWKTPSKLYYQCPTAPDLPLEERDAQTEYNIMNTLQHMTMVATAYQTSHECSEETIIDILVAGFCGQLKDKEIPDAVNTLIFTITQHFIGDPSLWKDRSAELLSNLKCRTLANFWRYMNTFLTRIYIREDSQQPFWKEKFLAGLPRSLGDKVRDKIRSQSANGDIPYESLSYGQLISYVQKVALKICQDDKIHRQLAKEKAQTKKYLSSFCEQFGLPACPKQKKKQTSRKEIHENKPVNKKRFERRKYSHKPLTSHISKYCRLKKKLRNLNLEPAIEEQINNLLIETLEEETKTSSFVLSNENLNLIQQDDQLSSTNDDGKINTLTREQDLLLLISLEVTSSLTSFVLNGIAMAGILEVVSNPWRFTVGNWLCDSDLVSPTGMKRVLTEKDLLADRYSDLEASILDENEFLLLKNIMLILRDFWNVPVIHVLIDIFESDFLIEEIVFGGDLVGLNFLKKMMRKNLIEKRYGKKSPIITKPTRSPPNTISSIRKSDSKISMNSKGDGFSNITRVQTKNRSKTSSTNLSKKSKLTKDIDYFWKQNIIGDQPTNVITNSQMKDGELIQSELPPATQYQLPNVKDSNNKPVMAIPFKTKDFNEEVTSKDIKSLMEQANYTNKYLQVLGETIKTKVVPKQKSTEEVSPSIPIEKPSFKPFKVSDKAKRKIRELRKTKSLIEGVGDNHSELLNKIGSLLKVIPETPQTSENTSKMVTRSTSKLINVINEDSDQDSENATEIGSVSEKNINPINSKHWKTPSKLYYQRPTAPNPLLEERGENNFNSFSANNIYEWNIDAQIEYNIMNALQHMTMVATVYQTSHECSEETIIDILVAGFSGQLKGWWDNYLTNEEKSKIYSAVKTDLNGKVITNDDDKEISDDAVNTLIFTIAQHFIGDPSLWKDRSAELLSNLKCRTLADFRWYRDTFLSRVYTREDSQQPFWKEKFLAGLPRSLGDKVRDKIRSQSANGDIPYEVASKICQDDKIQRQLAQEKAQTKKDLGSFCEQFGLLTCPKQKKKQSSKKEIHENKPINTLTREQDLLFEAINSIPDPQENKVFLEKLKKTLEVKPRQKDFITNNTFDITSIKPESSTQEPPKSATAKQTSVDYAWTIETLQALQDMGLTKFPKIIKKSWADIASESDDDSESNLQTMIQNASMTKTATNPKGKLPLAKAQTPPAKQTKNYIYKNKFLTVLQMEPGFWDKNPFKASAKAFPSGFHYKPTIILKTRTFYELILVDSNLVSIKHFKDPKDQTLNTHSTIQILKVIQPRHFGSDLNKGKRFSVPFDPVFWHQNTRFKHSWLIYFKTNTIYNFPNWILQWWDFFGPIPEIFPETVQQGFAQFERQYNSQESRIPVDLKYFSSFALSWIFSWQYRYSKTEKTSQYPSLQRHAFSHLAAFLAGSKSKEILTKNLKEVLQMLQQEDEGSSSKKEETSSAEEEEEDPFYQNEDDCFGICLD
ncbi:hypothetical protein HKD37_07G019133 [Glycine soja]